MTHGQSGSKLRSLGTARLSRRVCIDPAPPAQTMTGSNSSIGKQNQMSGRYTHAFAYTQSKGRQAVKRACKHEPAIEQQYDRRRIQLALPD